MVENSAPLSTRSVNKWAMKIFEEWQAGRRSKKAGEEETGFAMETAEIQDLETNICDTTAKWNYGKTQEKVPHHENCFVCNFCLFSWSLHYFTYL